MTKNKITIKTALLCMSLFLATACGNNTAGEESKDQAQEANNENLTREGEKDADRLVEIHGLNMLEIQTSETAVSKATDPEVKKIASMMVEAHTKMGAELQQLASNKGITLPTGLTNEQTRDIERLNEKTGADYDKEYLDLMKKGHDDVIDKLQNISDKGEDADIKAMADKSLPEVRSHLDMVEAAREKVKDTKKEGGKADDDRKGDKSNDNHHAH